MEKQDFKTLNYVVSAAILISLITVTAMCVIPRAILISLYEETEPYLDLAIRYTLEGNNPLAHEKIETAVENMEKSRKTLMLFYDHTGILELTGSIETALLLSETDDAAQLIEELKDAKKTFEFLIHADDISIYNIF